MAMDLLRWYRRAVALTTGDPKSFLSARRHVILLYISIIIIVYYIEYICIFSLEPLSQDMALVTTIVVAASSLLAFPFTANISKLLNLRRRLGEELHLAIVAASGASSTGLELVEFFRYLGARGARALKGFASLGSWFDSLSSLVGFERALLIVGSIASGDLRRILREHAQSLALGTGLEHLLSLSREIIAGAQATLARIMVARAQASIISITMITIIPIMIAGLSMLFGPWIMAASSPIILAVSCSASIFISDYPLPLRTTFHGKASRITSALSALSLLGLAPLIAEILGGSMSSNSLIVAGAAMAIGGLPEAILFVAGLRRLLSLGGVVSRAREHVRIYRSLSLFTDEELEKILSKDVRPWLADYMADAISFYREKGDVDPIVFEGFAEYVSTMLRGVRAYIASAAIVISVMASIPMLLGAVTVLGRVEGFNAEVFKLSVSVSASLIASKTMTGRIMPTLIGIAILLSSFY
jgi:hypothetical protein